jgi:hypothetical protein
MSNYKEKVMQFAFKELYMEACIEQILINSCSSDPRIVSPRMKEIRQLRDWYVDKQRSQNEQ